VRSDCAETTVRLLLALESVAMVALPGSCAAPGDAPRDRLARKSGLLDSSRLDDLIERARSQSETLDELRVNTADGLVQLELSVSAVANGVYRRTLRRRRDSGRQQLPPCRALAVSFRQGRLWRPGSPSSGVRASSPPRTCCCATWAPRPSRISASAAATRAYGVSRFWASSGIHSSITIVASSISLPCW
jgi:hypothetical protein